MKLKVTRGVADINSIDLDKIKTGIKWVDVKNVFQDVFEHAQKSPDYLLL